MKQEVTELICECLKELNAGIQAPELENPTPDTRLIGEKSALDSLGLVNLIADLEDKIATKYGKTLILADEKAMSLRISPFRRVDLLADYIVAKLSE